MSPVSTMYFGISGYVIFWLLFLIASGLFLQRVYFLYRVMRLGRNENRFDSPGRRIRSMLIETVFQWCNLKSVSLSRRYLAGVGHALLFWGFGLFLISYIIFIGLGEGFGLSRVMAGSTFELVYFSILDLVAVVVATAIIWAAIRRYIVKPSRLAGGTTTGVAFSLFTIFSLMVLHILTEGFGYAAYGIPASWPLIGTALARSLAGTGLEPGTLVWAYKGLWWLHYAIIIGFLVYIPRSKHLHYLTSFPNVAFKNLGPKGALKPINLEQTETFGVSKIQDFTWKDLLDLYTCTLCGQCQDVCPAYSSGKPLNPKKVILDLKEHLLAAGPALIKAEGKTEASLPNPDKVIPGKVVTEDEIWACTTCFACQEVCPVSIEQMRKIIELRRNLVMEQAQVPETGEGALRSIEARGHPWRGTTYSRTDWAQGLEVKTLAESRDVDLLFWVGCTGALEDRSIKIAQAIARLLGKAQVNFAILGTEESCCGEPARILGNEYLFQMQAQRNIEIMKGYNVRKIVVSCPHCFQTLKHEYPGFGGEFEVYHHTEFIANLLKEGRLKIPEGTDGIVTYHDSCYLGRYNGVYQPPRQILSSIPNARIVEIVRNRERSFCCGGGGGHMWLEETSGRRISELRLEQVMETGAGTIATACPYCLQMFDDAIRAKAAEESIKVMDIAELVEKLQGQ